MELLRATPLVTHQRAKNVAVSDPKQGQDIEGHTFFVATTYSTKDDNGKLRRAPSKYKTKLTIVDPQHRYVKVDCTCAFHPFSGSEVSLSLRNAADILRSNGRAPKVRNPSMSVYTCKHLVALMMKLHALGRIR